MMIRLKILAQYRWVFACLCCVCTSLGRLILTCAAQQVPSPWRPQMEDMTNMQLFFSFYSSTSPPLSSMALECLVSYCTNCASVRLQGDSGVALPYAYACSHEQMAHLQYADSSLVFRCDLHRCGVPCSPPRWSEASSLLNWWRAPETS